MGYVVALAGALTLASCGGGESSGGTSHQVVVRTDGATASQCPNGGSVVKSGLDQNDNGTLDDSEVASSAVVCKPAAATTGVVTRLVAEPPGAHCATGGTAVLSGPDRNGDGTLGDDEVTHTDYVCGTMLLHTIASEPAGAHCADGGVAFSFGLDLNGSGTLDAGEVADVEYACGNTLSRNVVIQQASDVAALASVVAIHGSLTIANTSLLSAALPLLQYVDGDVAITGNGRLATLSLLQLRAVTGALTLSGNSTTALELPQLSVVTGAFTMTGGAFTTLSLPRLQQVGSLQVSDNASLTTLDGFAALTQVIGDVTITNVTKLTSLALPNLRAGGSLVVRDDMALTQLSWTLSGRQRDVTIQRTGIEELKIDTQEANDNTAAVENVAVLDNPALVDVSLMFQRVTTIWVQGNDTLDSLDIGAALITGDVTIQDNPTQRFLRFSDGLGLPGRSGVRILGSLTVSAPVESLSFAQFLGDNLVLGNVSLIGTKLQDIVLPPVGSGLDIEHNSELKNPLFTFGFDSLTVVDNPKLVHLLSEPIFHDTLSFVTITGNAALTDISGLDPMLAAFNVTITDNPVLATGISAGLTRIDGTLTVKNNAALTDLGLPNLQSADSISIDSNPALAAIALRSLTSAPKISVRNNSAAQHFDMSALTQSTSVSVIFNQHLASCEVRASLSHVLSNILEVRNNDDNAQCP